MRKFKFVSVTALSLLFVTPLTYAADSKTNSLKYYQEMIDQARNQPAATINPRNNNQAVSNGQAALTPAPVVNQPPTVNYSNVTPTAPTQSAQATPNNVINQPAQNAGPPNIFITPGNNNNSTNNQGSSVIHY